MLTWLFWVSDFVKRCEQFFIYHGAGKLITFWLDGNDDVWFVLHQYTLLLDFNSTSYLNQQYCTQVYMLLHLGILCWQVFALSA